MEKKVSGFFSPSKLSVLSLRHSFCQLEHSPESHWNAFRPRTADLYSVPRELKIESCFPFFLLSEKVSMVSFHSGKTVWFCLMWNWPLGWNSLTCAWAMNPRYLGIYSRPYSHSLCPSHDPLLLLKIGSCPVVVILICTNQDCFVLWFFFNIFIQTLGKACNLFIRCPGIFPLLCLITLLGLEHCTHWPGKL